MKLNLGCGQRKISGYLNVDKFGDPDTKWDLEVLPWPWPDGSATVVLATHVLEHLGATPDLLARGERALAEPGLRELPARVPPRRGLRAVGDPDGAG